MRTEEGRVYAWGDNNYGAYIPAATQAALDASPGCGFDTVASTAFGAFLVRTHQGRAYAFGGSLYGGLIPAATHKALDASLGLDVVASTLTRWGLFF